MLTRRMNLFVALFLAMLGMGQTASAWTDIKADLTNGSFFTAEETNVTTAGLKMNADGTFTRVATDAADANAVITGKYHSNEHGLGNFSAVVKVEGPVKISMGTCAWGGDVTIKNAAGETVGTFNTNTGACYHQNKAENIASTLYKGDATTLTISGGSYTPYFAVEALAAAKGTAYIVDLTNGNLLTADEIANKNNFQFGLSMVNGTATRIAAEGADCVLNGKYHSNEHGWGNFSAAVKVEGPVKVSMGTCAWGGDVTIKDASGATVGTFNTNTGACYHNNKAENIAFTYYKGDATTLTVSGGAYTPYFAVEPVSIADIPSDIKVTFSLGSETAEGVLPAEDKAEIGADYTLPLNRTLFVAGKTLTGWTDGTNTYKPGETIKAGDKDINLTAVFTANSTSLADRTEPVDLNFDFQRKNGAPLLNYQGGGAIGIYVTQAVVNGQTIDVKLDFDATNGKIANGNWNDWAQMNGGTKFTIPSCKGAVVSIEAYSNITTTTIDGQTDYTQGQTISYEIANTAETIDIVIGDGSYYRYIKVNLPVVQSTGGKTYTDQATSVVWPFNDHNNVSAYTATPEGVFSTVAVNTGDLEITGVGSRTADNNAEGISFIKFKPSGTTKAVQWVVKPASGLTFTPTKLSLWIQRFGTDAENGVTVTAQIGEGEAVTLGNYTAPRNNQGTEKDKYAGNSNYTNQVVIELTAEQQAALTSGETLTISATVGVGSSKEGGFSQVTIDGLVNGTTADVAKYTLSAVATPEEGGSVNVYPASEEFEDGTEVTLTATENFGYDFVNWTDAEGNEVSKEAKFKYTVKSNVVLTANFKKVNTYELKVSVDGTNAYMVQPSPLPTVVDGKNMYEEGTEVTLTANSYEGLVTFTNWSDGQTTSEIKFNMTEDKDITAVYSQADIIAGWDFYKAGGSGRPADFAAEENDADVLNLVNTQSGESSGWLDKSTIGGGGYESFKGAAVNWRTGNANGDVGNWHWQTKINATAFTDINVQFQMLYNYNAYQTYDVEFSTNGTDWTKAGSITMTGTKSAASFNGKLPAETNNQETLHIRMLADKTSKVDGAASQNDGNTLAMFFITGTPKLVNDGKAPVLQSSVPAEGATNASASGKIVLTFDEKVKVAENAQGDLSGTKLTPAVSGKTVTFEYKALDYSKAYTFSLPANSVADLTDNYVAEAITINFTTMTRPTVTKGNYNFIVPDDGTITEALAAANGRADKATRYRIFIKNGNYVFDTHGTTTGGDGKNYPDPRSHLTAPNVSFIGESMEGVVITNQTPEATWNNGFGTACPLEGIGNGDVLIISSTATNTYFQNLTIKTSMGDAHGRDIALNDQSNKTIFKDACLWGYQDTYVSNNSNGKFYFEGGVLRGRTDFLCGKGDVYYNQVTLRQVKSGYLAVPSQPKKYGYIFQSCKIVGDTDDVNGTYTLGRPWGSGTPIALFINTEMEVAPSAIGWNEMSGGWPKRFAEYNSHLSSGTLVDLSNRKTTFGDHTNCNNPVLTAEEAALYTLPTVMGQDDDWDPTLYTEQAPVPTNVKLNGNTLTWDNSDYVLCWAVCQNGKVVAFTTEPTYTIVEGNVGEYTVRAANEMGGLSEPSGTVTGIEQISTAQAANGDAIYNAQGIRVQKAGKGLYIINGKKVVK